MADQQPTPGLTMAGMMSLAASVRQALTSLDPHAGAAAIVQVRSALAHVPGTDVVSTTLASLHAELTSAAPDGAHVSGLLGALSEETRAVAGRAGLLVGGGLALLADRLAAVGDELARRG